MPRAALLAVAGFAAGFAYVLGATSPEACSCRLYESWRLRLAADSSDPIASALLEAGGGSDDAATSDQLGHFAYQGGRYTLRYKRLWLDMERR